HVRKLRDLYGLFSTSICPSYSICIASYFFFTDHTTTDIYTLSLHDALPICRPHSAPTQWPAGRGQCPNLPCLTEGSEEKYGRFRSEEHTSELQSRGHLVCRLLLEKKNECHHKKHFARLQALYT